MNEEKVFTTILDKRECNLLDKLNKEYEDYFKPGFVGKAIEVVNHQVSKAVGS